MRRKFGILLLISCISFVASAQDTLPSFTLVNKGNNRIIISWSNPYTDIRQLSIQRSTDSSKNFKSILTLPDPTVPQNGYVDTKAPSEQVFYRLYILLDSGKYVFSKSKKPVLDTIRIKEPPKPIKAAVQLPADTLKAENKVPAEEPKTEPKRTIVTEEPKPVIKKVTVTEEPKPKDPEKAPVVKPEVIKPKEIPEKIIYVKRRDSVIAEIGEKSVRHFKDSVATRTKDTLSLGSMDTLVIKPFIPKEVYKTSRYVFTEKDGNVKIALPLAADKKYTIKFFDELNAPVFEIKQIKNSVLILDKSNFMHAGWFKFELYEDGQLKEKSRLFVPKDF